MGMCECNEVIHIPSPIWLFSQILHAKRGEGRNTSDFPLKLCVVARRCRRCGPRCFCHKACPLLQYYNLVLQLHALIHITGEDDHFCRRQNKDTELSMFLVSHIYRPSFVSLRKLCGGGGMNGRSLQVGICMFGMCRASVWPLYNNVGPVSCWHTKDLLTEIPIRS